MAFSMLSPQNGFLDRLSRVYLYVLGFGEAQPQGQAIRQGHQRMSDGDYLWVAEIALVCRRLYFASA